MLPPKAPGVLVATASLRAGAVPRQPSIGRSGSSMARRDRRRIQPRCPLALSMIQLARCGSRSTRLAIDPDRRVRREQTAREAGRAVGLQALDRDDDRIAGSAPSTKNGPVCGFGPCATDLPFQSVPEASIVFVITRSPGLILSAGGCANENVL